MDKDELYSRLMCLEHFGAGHDYTVAGCAKCAARVQQAKEYDTKEEAAYRKWVVEAREQPCQVPDNMWAMAEGDEDVPRFEW